MPLTTGKGGITTSSGNTTQVLLAEQANFADEATIARIGDYYRYQPRISSADIAGGGTTIESNFFDGSAAQSKDAPGPFDIEGGFTIGASANGSALFYRMLTQDKNPTATPRPDSAAKDVVASTEALSDNREDATLVTANTTPTNPVRITITPSGSATVPAGTRAIIGIEGTDEDGTVITEQIAFTTATQSMAGTTKLWYKTITRIYSQGFDEASGKTYGATVQDQTQIVTFTPQDLELVAYWSGEITKGIVPNRYFSLILQSATMSLDDRETLAAFDCTFLGRRAELYQNIAGDTGASARATPLSTLQSNNIELASSDVYASWQAKLTGENTDIELAVQSVTLTFNNELEYTNTLGDQFQGAPPGRGGKRLVEIAADVLYSPQNNFSDYYNSNLTIPNLKLVLSQSGYGVYPYDVTFQFEEAQFTSNPDPAVSEFGTIPQSLALKAVKRDRATPDYQITARYSEYEAVRDYS